MKGKLYVQACMVTFALQKSLKVCNWSFNYAKTGARNIGLYILAIFIPDKTIFIVIPIYTVNAKGILKVFWKTVRYLRVFKGI